MMVVNLVRAKIAKKGSNYPSPSCTELLLPVGRNGGAYGTYLFQKTTPLFHRVGELVTMMH
jgi:hypothetical protein